MPWKDMIPEGHVCTKYHLPKAREALKEAPSGSTYECDLATCQKLWMLMDDPNGPRWEQIGG